MFCKYFQGNKSGEHTTRTWLTRSHLNRILTILSPFVTNYLIEEAEEKNEESKRDTEPQNIEMVEDVDIKLAVIFM